MKRSFAIALLAAGAVTLAPVEVRAQEAPPYGPQITLDVARKVAAAAEVEAKKNNWRMAVHKKRSAHRCSR